MALKHIIKGGLISVLATLTLTISAVLIWYCCSFLPHLVELRHMIRRGHASSSMVAQALHAMAIADNSEEALRFYATREAYYLLAFNRGPRSTMTVWHLNTTLWYYASYLHFSDQDIFGMWVDCSLYGCAQGLPVTSQRYFAKELGQLTDRELASLVAVIRQPTRYAPGTPDGDKRAEKIFEKVNLEINK